MRVRVRWGTGCMQGAVHRNYKHLVVARYDATKRGRTRDSFIAMQQPGHFRSMSRIRTTACQTFLALAALWFAIYPVHALSPPPALP